MSESYMAIKINKVNDYFIGYENKGYNVYSEISKIISEDDKIVMISIQQNLAAISFQVVFEHCEGLRFNNICRQRVPFLYRPC